MHACRVLMKDKKMGEYLHKEYGKVEDNMQETKINAKHFIVGPVEIYPEVSKIYDREYTYFRTSEYSELVQTTLKKLSIFLGNNEENSTIYLASSGTGAMEAAVENCVEDYDKCLVINGGTFGHRFCELLKYHDKKYSSVDLAWDEELTYNHLKPYEAKQYTMLFVNLHETHTGQLYNMQMLSDFCKRNNMLLVVDAISTFLADEYDMDKYGIDVTIISSQKGLCLSPGMSLVSFSRRMLEKLQKSELKPSKYFDFKDYLKNIERGQTPYTPTVFIMYELQEMLSLIEAKGGKKVWLGYIDSKAKYLRAQLNKLGFKIPNYPLSNLLTPIILDNVNAYEVIQVLKNKYGLYVNPCGGDLAEKLIRVSHIGNTTHKDLENLLEKLVLAVEEVKNRGLVNVR